MPPKNEHVYLQKCRQEKGLNEQNKNQKNNETNILGLCKKYAQDTIIDHSKLL